MYVSVRKYNASDVNSVYLTSEYFRLDFISPERERSSCNKKDNKFDNCHPFCVCVFVVIFVVVVRNEA